MIDILKQSTAANILAFLVSSSDHLTGKTGLDGSLTVSIAKQGSGFGTITPTTSEVGYGWYSLTLTTTHTNTLGTLAVHITSGSEIDAYDAQYRVSTDNFDSVVDSTWDEILTGATHNVTNSAGKRLRNVASNVIYTGTVVSASANMVQLDSGADSSDGAYDPALIAITSGTGTGQSRLVLQYTGSTRIAVIDRDWKVLPTAGDDYIIFGDAGREHVNEGLIRSGSTLDVQLNANASGTDGEYVGQVIFIRSGTGQDQARRITGYNGTTKVASTRKAWNPILDATSAYVMLPTSELDVDKVYSGTASAVWNAVLSNYSGSGTAGSALGNIGDTVWDAKLIDHTVNGSTGERLALTPTAATVSSEVWNEVLSGHTGSGTAGKALSDAGATGNPWSYPVRTLTTPAVEITTASATDINCMRGDTFYAAISGMGDMTGWSSVYFTVKEFYKKDIDSESIFQVAKFSGSSGSSGLVYLNSASVVDMTSGSITVIDKDDGDITIMVKPDATKDLAVKDNCYYDVEVVYSSGSVLTLANGTFNILGDVTRAIV